jgi:hypothetical protein
MVVMNLLADRVSGECCLTSYSGGHQSGELALVQVFLDMSLSYRIFWIAHSEHRFAVMAI